MHIQAIEVEGFHDGARSGNVTLVANARRINIPLILPDSGEAPKRQTVVAEAIRLTRRMPEYRAGARQLSFAPKLLADAV